MSNDHAGFVQAYIALCRKYNLTFVMRHVNDGCGHYDNMSGLYSLGFNEQNLKDFLNEMGYISPGLHEGMSS